jgi:Zn-finger nucleic acid-binding protein
MDIPNRRHPRCPDVHLGLCPKCRRLWAAELTDKAKAREAVSDEPRSLEPSRGGKRVVKSRPFTRAEISRRQRERDPEAYRAWNRERMKRKRQEARDALRQEA